MKITCKILLAFCLITLSFTITAQDFFEAIGEGQLEKVEQYIHDEPSLLDSIVKWECTPLMFAAYMGKDSIVEFLLEKGADIYLKGPSDGMNPLHLASQQNHMSVVNILINAKMDVNIMDGANKTALIYAIENSNVEIIDIFLQANAKLPKEEVLMNLCLHSAVLNDLTIIDDKLLENGAPLSGIDKYGRSLLHNAIIGNNKKWIEKLIEKKVDFNVVDSFNRTALHYSVELNQIGNIKKLVQQKVKINGIDCSNRTPLDIAQDFNNSEIATLLESNGATNSKPLVFELKGNREKPSEIKVSYIANTGVMISSDSQKILIDAVFNESYSNYATTPKNVVSALNNNVAPYDSINLLLITHNHGDHFSAPMIAEYLAQNPSTKVVCNKSVASAIIDTIVASADNSNIIGITPDFCSSTDTLVDNLEIKVLRLRHGGQGIESDNVGFVFELDGIKIFHSGDSNGRPRRGEQISGLQEYDSVGIASMDIDLAILDRGWLGYSQAPGIEILDKLLRPQKIILTHLSDYNKQGEWESVDKTIRENKDALPELTSFRWQFQEVIIRK